MSAIILDEIRSCNSEAARARILLSTPLSLLWDFRSEFRAAFETAGFLHGRDCLDAEIAMMAARRLADGSHGQTVLLTLQASRSVLRQIAREGVAGQ